MFFCKFMFFPVPGNFVILDSLGFGSLYIGYKYKSPYGCTCKREVTVVGPISQDA